MTPFEWDKRVEKFSRCRILYWYREYNSEKIILGLSLGSGRLNSPLEICTLLTSKMFHQLSAKNRTPKLQAHGIRRPDFGTLQLQLNIGLQNNEKVDMWKYSTREDNF